MNFTWQEETIIWVYHDYIATKLWKMASGFFLFLCLLFFPYFLLNRAEQFSTKKKCLRLLNYQFHDENNHVVFRRVIFESQQINKPELNNGSLCLKIVFSLEFIVVVDRIGKRLNMLKNILTEAYVKGNLILCFFYGIFCYTC